MTVLLTSCGEGSPGCLVPRLGARARELHLCMQHMHLLTAAAAGPGWDCEAGDRVGGSAQRAWGGQAERGGAHLQDPSVLPLAVLEHRVAGEEDETLLADAVRAVPIVLQLRLVVGAASTNHLQPPDRDTRDTEAGLGDPGTAP